MKLFLIILSLLVAAGCTENTNDANDANDNQDYNYEVKPTKIDISNTSSVVSVKKSSAVASYSIFDPRRYYTAFAAMGDQVILYKKTDDGQFIEIQIEDASGDIITTTIPMIDADRMNANNTVVYFGYPNNCGEDICTESKNLAIWTYRVDNLTGEAFDFSDEGKPTTPYLFYKHSAVFQNDSSDNMFYMTEFDGARRQINKIDEQTKEIINISPEADHILVFSTSYNGEILYLGYDWEDLSKKRTVAIGSNGVVTEISSETEVYMSVWTGLDGALYVWNRSERVAKKVVFDGSGDATLEDYGTPVGMQESLTHPNSSYITKTATRVFIGSDAISRIFDVYNPFSQPIYYSYASQSIQNIYDMTSSSSKLYVALKNTSDEYTIVEFVEDFSTQQNMLTPNDYQVDRIKYDGTDEMVFYGRRIADQMKFLGTVNLTTKAVTELATGLDAEVQSVERIN